MATVGDLLYCGIDPSAVSAVSMAFGSLTRGRCSEPLAASTHNDFRAPVRRVRGLVDNHCLHLRRDGTVIAVASALGFRGGVSVSLRCCENANRAFEVVGVGGGANL